MKKENINLILGGIGVIIALSMMGAGKKGDDGAESGGFQLPSFYPAGTGAGEVAPAATYNISFPEFPGFPTGGETKKDIAVSSTSVFGTAAAYRATQATPTSDPYMFGYQGSLTDLPQFAGMPGLVKSTSSKSTGGMGTITGTPTVKVTQPVTKKTVTVPQKSFNLKYIGK